MAITISVYHAQVVPCCGTFDPPGVLSCNSISGAAAHTAHLIHHRKTAGIFLAQLLSPPGRFSVIMDLHHRCNFHLLLETVTPLPETRRSLFLSLFCHLYRETKGQFWDNSISFFCETLRPDSGANARFYRLFGFLEFR